jgi:hypothetical protein
LGLSKARDPVFSLFSINESVILAYHFVLVRQVLENLASFLGVGQFGYVLEQIGFEKKEDPVFSLFSINESVIFLYDSLFSPLVSQLDRMEKKPT